MTMKEYLSQARWIDQKIKADMAELARLRQTMDCVSSPGFEQSYNATKSTEAPFVRHMERIDGLEAAVAAEIDRLAALKGQIRQTIATVPDLNERLVLEYRYTGGMTWEQIGLELGVDASTIRRWHNGALSHAAMPEEPIVA